jgi:hypothetical protein
MRHRLIALPLASLASLVLASVALAGGWAEVTVKDTPVDPPAGGGTPIELSVLQHGVTPVSWPHLSVIATDAASGAMFKTDAQAKGPEGTYVATIVFPKAGEWTLSFDSPELEMSGTAAINVTPVVTAPQPGAETPATQSLDPVALLGVLISAVLIVAFAGVAIKGRRAIGETRVTVRT